jgi:hypothetical protein
MLEVESFVCTKVLAAVFWQGRLLELFGETWNDPSMTIMLACVCFLGLHLVFRISG